MESGLSPRSSQHPDPSGGARAQAAKRSAAKKSSIRKTGRRRPLASALLISAGLMVTGAGYVGLDALTSVSAENKTVSQEQNLDRGNKLFLANCATCHGLNAQGTEFGPSLIGVGAAAVDFQVGSGRMPMQMSGPQAMRKPPQFGPEDISALAAWVASLAPGPAIPEEKYLDGKGDIARGGELFRTNCAMCHNVAAAGGAMPEGKFAPSLHGVPAAHIYEAMLIGPQAMPVFSDLNITPEQKRDIISYLKYIESHGSPGGYGLESLGPVSEGLFMWIFILGGIVGITVWVAARSN